MAQIITIIISNIIIYSIITQNNTIGEYISEVGYLDGINKILIGMISIIYSIIIIKTKKREEKWLILLSEIIVILTLLTIDIFIFYILFELSVVPLFLLIGFYGSKNRWNAAKTYYIYSLIGGLFLLVAIIILYIKYGTTNLLIYNVKLNNDINKEYLYLIWIALFITLAIKIPIYPLHSWLPLAHSEASTKGSVILAGIILKLGTYGIFRYLLSMSTEVPTEIINIIKVLGIISIIYGSMLALNQIDIKKIIAYSSIIHINFSICSLFSSLPGTYGMYSSYVGSVYLMYTHGILSSAMFILIGILYQRFHTRIITYYNDLISYMPIFTIYFFLFTLNLLSLPTTASFISEYLILQGIYHNNIYLGIIVTSFIFLNTLFTLSLFNRMTFGKTTSYLLYFKDLSLIECTTLTILLIISLIMGIYPSSILSFFSIPVLTLLS